MLDHVRGQLMHNAYIYVLPLLHHYRTPKFCYNRTQLLLYVCIQKVALGDPLPAAEDLEDDTLPDVEGQALHADAIQAFQDACYGKEYAQELATRKAAGGAGAAKSKGTKRKEEAEVSGTPGSVESYDTQVRVFVYT